MRVTVIPIVVGALGTVPKGLERRCEELKNGKNRDYSDYSIVEFGLNTEKSPGKLRSFIVTQTLVKVHKLTLA